MLWYAGHFLHDQAHEAGDKLGPDLAAEIETVGADFGHLGPMLDAAQRELAGAGILRYLGVEPARRLGCVVTCDQLEDRGHERHEIQAPGDDH